jgi:hypothetical protein
MTYNQVICYGTLSSQALVFGKANAMIVQQYGHDAGIVLNTLIDLHLCQDIPASKEFEVSVASLQHRTTLTKYKQANALKELSRAGIVVVVSKGNPKRRYIILSFTRILEVITQKFLPVLHFSSLKKDDEEENIEKKSTSPVLQGFPGSEPEISSQGEITLTGYPEYTEDEVQYLQGILAHDGAFNLTDFRTFLLTGASEYCKTTKREIIDFAVYHQIDPIQIFLAGYHGKQHHIVHPMRWLQTFPFDANGRFNQMTDNGQCAIIHLAAWYAGQLNPDEVTIVQQELMKLNCGSIYSGFLKPTVCEKLQQLKTYWEEHHETEPKRKSETDYSTTRGAG